MARLGLLLVGLWLGLLVASSAVATVNFRTVDRLLGPDLRPELAQRLGPVPEADRRFAFRHLASEANRWVFRTGSLAQLLLAVVLLAVTWPSGGAPRALAAAALLLTAAQALFLAGALASFGRPLDFVPRPLPPELARRFALLHGAYVLGDVAKLALLVASALLLLRRPAA
ncbi:MAG TPA: hypothetical protein VEQ10_11410 [Vicinamibacteria bacterium]|nr:hypothetical protein [Vicinamibacteria bacterium]